jgi:hypothetical protein
MKCQAFIRSTVLSLAESAARIATDISEGHYFFPSLAITCRTSD